jgi:Lrp/AsnC family transcriptional regulator, regulator for asnA, asnC and gidA
MKRNNQIQLDEIDKKILSTLLLDGKTPYAEIGKGMFLSAGTVHVRIKKMMDAGIICGNHIDVNYKILGYDITAFLGIYLEKSSLYEQVIEELKLVPEVLSAHYTTGNYGIFAKIITKDTDHLRDTLSNKIQKIKGIQRTETFISLEESIDRPLDIERME